MSRAGAPQALSGTDENPSANAPASKRPPPSRPFIALPMSDLRLAALQALACPEPEAKVALTLALDLTGPLDASAQLEPPATPIASRF